MNTKRTSEQIFKELERVCNILPTPIYWLNTTGVVLGANDIAFELIGGSNDRERIIDQEHDSFYPKDVAHTLTENNNKAIKLGQTIEFEEKIVNMTTGAVQYLTSIRSPLRNDEDEIIGIIGTSIDITDRKEAECLKIENERQKAAAVQEQYLIRKKFGDMAAEVAHDLGSPLNAMNVAISSLKQAKVATDDILLLERAMQSVKGITGELLNRYRNLDQKDFTENSHPDDDGNQPRHIVLSSLIADIVANKTIEWSKNPCNIYYNVDKNTPIWLFASPLQFSRVLSNLLNNSYESMNKEIREIHINLLLNNDKINFNIKDNGCGILPEQLSKVLAGKSLKHAGNGIGLSGAKRYFESLNGTLSLTSIYGEGTEITTTMLVANPPKWFNNEIAYNNQTTFVVLDDDASIIMLWQRKFMKLNIKCNYFTNVLEFRSWYLANKSEHIVLLVDYDLQDSKTGVDVIKEYETINAYLITSHAEDSWLQNLVTNNEETITLIPKSLIDCIKFIKA